MLIAVLLGLNIVVCIALVGVVLLQRSEGGALGMGGGPTGFMTARGAGDFLTRTTWILFAAFMILSLSLTLISGRQRAQGSVVSRLKIQAVDPRTLNKPAPTTPPAQTPPPGGLAAPAPQVNPGLLPGVTPPPAPVSAPGNPQISTLTAPPPSAPAPATPAK